MLIYDHLRGVSVVSSLGVKKLLIFKFERQYVISSFPSYSEKNIYLCHTLSAHQRDETGKSGFLFLNGVNNVLSLKLEN